MIEPGPAAADGGRELFVRHARKDGRSVAVIRALDRGEACVVEAEVYPPGIMGAGPARPERPGPYRFGSGREATAFVTDVVEALMYLGCDIHSK